MPATTIYLIRHGETTWNAEGRFQGNLDSPMTELGQLQIRNVVDALRHTALAAVYSSPLERAQETASPIAAARGLPVVVADGFRELNLGRWESRVFAELEGEDARRMQAWRDTPHQVRMPGGETLAEVQDRAMRALGEIAVRHPGGAVAAVAHGGVNKTVLLAVLGAPLSHYWRIRQGNGCINMLEIDGAWSRVVAVNETAHLSRWTPHPFA